MSKKKILISNLLVRQQNCDSFCKYCYHKNQLKLTECYAYKDELKEKIDKIFKFSTDNFECPVIKIAGGEIFLMSNLKEFVEHLLELYPYVLIQTNGKHLDDEALQWIIDKKRILIQMSMDGHELDMNQYRIDTEEMMVRLRHAIEVLKKNDVYLEITSVLNNKNTGKYDKFIEYLDSLPSGTKKNNLKVSPILLIDSEGIYTAAKDDTVVIEKLLQNYDRYSHILPPKKYMDNLYELLQGNKLRYQCYNPIVSVNYTEDGKMKGCTNVLDEEVLNVGNVLEESAEDLMNKFGKTKFQKLLVKTEQWVPLCKTCFNFCSIYSLYLNDSITLEELCSNNMMFDLPEIKQALIEVKKEIQASTQYEIMK